MEQGQYPHLDCRLLGDEKRKGESEGVYVALVFVDRLYQRSGQRFEFRNPLPQVLKTGNEIELHDWPMVSKPGKDDSYTLGSILAWP
jgi:hypothetical protein